MKLSITVISLCISSAIAQMLTINTPMLIMNFERERLSRGHHFTFSIPGNQPSAAPLANLGQKQNTFTTWIVNQPAGTSIELIIRDNVGHIAQSASFTVQTSVYAGNAS
ncbi:hypothetical protein BDQ12DRAFT_667937 [Crucibulum laeve]|uniref:Ser-Thr-rich glycosyl-phosphatidyl-inositol-anchored membrane family-domain-containing protein n=1 Tax=Crucibulum laeve TaxID=68775 RepID=A0A5C3LVT6_9AGAR|nr:hypothetical protein BDQ12DRAFT_667937 [Crucibulum laeve]